MLPGDALGKALHGLGHHGLVAGDGAVLFGQLDIGVIAHEQALPGGVGHLTGRVLLALDHAADHKGPAVDLDAHPLQVRAAEEHPGQLLVEQDEILHQILLGNVAAAQQTQRMKGEEVAAHGDAEGVARAAVAGSPHLAHRAPGVLPKPVAAVGVERGRMELVQHAGPEGVYVLQAHRLVHRDEAGDLCKALLARPLPALRGVLAGERAAQAVQPEEAEPRRQQQEDAEAQQPDPSLFHISHCRSSAPGRRR